ncbi:MAG: L-tyrosine/L-tryptophan isonitrile synthase family protein [Candidatus Pacearchaeota archaeon]
MKSVEEGRPIEFVLPSFPVKCFNPLKVRRREPDLAEVASLSRLYSLCREIARIYSPGARFMLVLDGLVYAPIFREPLQYSREYKNKLIEMVCKMRISSYIHISDMSGLVNSLKEEFKNVSERVKEDITKYWKSESFSSEVNGLINNTMTNINLMNYSESSLLEAFNYPSESPVRSEIEEIAKKSAFEYLVFNQTIKEISLLERYFPEALRVTCHPKEGQIGLHLVHPKSFNFPWNGVGIMKKDGTVRVEFEHEARRDPNYIPVYIKGQNHPFYFQELRNYKY